MSKNMGMDPEWRDQISAKALKKCTDEFNELARDCAVALATILPEFDGSKLTQLMQTFDPDCWPNPDKTAYHKNSATIHVEATFAMQRNYFTSAANLYLPLVAVRGHKTHPERAGTHDKVCLYRSRIYNQRAVAIPHRLLAAYANMEHGK